MFEMFFYIVFKNILSIHLILCFDVLLEYPNATALSFKQVQILI